MGSGKYEKKIVEYANKILKSIMKELVTPLVLSTCLTLLYLTFMAIFTKPKGINELAPLVFPLLALCVALIFVFKQIDELHKLHPLSQAGVRGLILAFLFLLFAFTANVAMNTAKPESIGYTAFRWLMIISTTVGIFTFGFSLMTLAKKVFTR